MAPLMIVLRLFHILSGVFWAGSVFFLVSILMPGAAKQGADGRKFVVGLMSKTRMINALPLAGLTTVISGLLLFWKDSSHMDPDWLMSGTGLTFAVGAVAGLIGGTLGGGGAKPISDRPLG